VDEMEDGQEFGKLWRMEGRAKIMGIGYQG
jgi:hypothetical protein